MALSGLQIYKLLPKTNCKDCGFPTCLAFAMKLAAKQVELSVCPRVSEEAQAALAAAAAPPVRLITLGKDDNKIEVGNETVLFRHEKKFFHEPGLFVRVKDNQEDAAAVAERVASYSVERVGMNLRLNGIVVENASGDAATFANCVAAVRGKTDWPLILMSDSAEALGAALDKEGGNAPLLYAATPDNWKEVAALAKKHKAALVVRDSRGAARCAPTGLSDLTEKVKGAGVADIVLDPGTREFADTLAQLTILRRLALKKNFRPLGYPLITFAGEGADSVEEEVALASEQIAKYGGFIVLDHFDEALAYVLLTLRLNIYTDPQKPIQVKPGLYEFSSPSPDAPLLVTTNFSLTFFSVAGELDGLGKPAWLLIADSEGMSVLTAWAAGKFDAEKIAKAVQDFGVAAKISHKSIIIPGFVATISGELEEELPDWNIKVGPREAVDIPAYLKTVWK